MLKDVLGKKKSDQVNLKKGILITCTASRSYYLEAFGVAKLKFLEKNTPFLLISLGE